MIWFMEHPHEDVDDLILPLLVAVTNDVGKGFVNRQCDVSRLNLTESDPLSQRDDEGAYAREQSRLAV